MVELGPLKEEVFDLLILYSGGADSRLMLEFALRTHRKPYCLLIDYGQLHKDELQFAATQLGKLSVSYQIVTVGGLLYESGLTGSGEQGTFGKPDEISIWHVPGRNTMFAGIALGVAENRRIGEVWHGADFSDRLNLFPDCYQEYVVKMNELYSIAGPTPVKYMAPLSGMTKEMILELLKEYGVPENEIFSGYGSIQAQI
jgi:7-cyano-7-deazaguanine synthase